MHGDPGLDLWAFDIRRFGGLHAGQEFLHDRAVESYAQYYAVHWPGEELETARHVRRSPLYQTLRDQGAVYGAKFGWERANWFAGDGIEQKDVFGWDRPGQHITVGREHKAAREGVVMIDMSSFTKFEISGRDACGFLQYLAVANVDKAPGSATYTQLCNENGGIEADVTIIRRSKDCFWLITGSGLGVRDRDWIERNIQGFRSQRSETWVTEGEQWRQRYAGQGGHGADVVLRDITSGYGVINLAGPLSRQVLEKVTDSDVSHEQFAFMSCRDIRIGYAPAVAYRVTYIGELGWELYIPTEYMQFAYEVLQKAGQEFGITDAGYRAIDSLRLEKRYLAWGVDISPDYNPFEAGLQFLIDWNKGNFIGREALAGIKQKGITQKLVCLELEEPLAVFGGEAVFHDGTAVAQTTSGNFGYSVAKSLVLAYLPTNIIAETKFEVEAFGQRSKANIIKGCAYDPKRRKILC
jgi:glycine cleavage system aminomethyltransferase T